MSRIYLAAISILASLLMPAITLAQDDLVLPYEGAPQFELYGLSSSHQRGPALVVNYEKTKEGNGRYASIYLTGKSSQGSLTSFSIMDVLADQPKEGKITMGLSTQLWGTGSFELYLVTTGPSGKTHMVSNPVRIGNPGNVTQPRPMNEAEMAKLREAIIRTTPPAKAPAGFVMGSEVTKSQWVPGIPVKAGHNGSWCDAELIAVDGWGYAKLVYENEPKLVRHPFKTWVAIAPTTLEKVKEDPSQFKPSIRILEGGSKIIPDGMIPVSDDVKLLPGVPLVLESSVHGWKQVMVVEAAGKDVHVTYVEYGRTKEWKYPRAKFIIESRIRDQLADAKPALVKRFQRELDKIPPASNGRRSSTSTANPTGKSGTGNPPSANGSIKHKQYPVNIDGPSGSQFVPDNVAIPEGTKLQACYARKWNPITSISENEDGSLYVHWDDYSSSFDCNMTRNQLIIKNSILRKLKKRKPNNNKIATKESSKGSSKEEPTESANMAKPKDSFVEKLQKTKRTWTDRTGKHKVRAYFVSKEGDSIKLRKENGTEITLEIKRLSENDRKIIDRIPINEGN